MKGNVKNEEVLVAFGRPRLLITPSQLRANYFKCQLECANEDLKRENDFRKKVEKIHGVELGTSVRKRHFWRKSYFD